MQSEDNKKRVEEQKTTRNTEDMQSEDNKKRVEEQKTTRNTEDMQSEDNKKRVEEQKTTRNTEDMQSEDNKKRVEQFLKWTLAFFIGFFGICLLFLGLITFQGADNMKLISFIFFFITLVLITIVLIYSLRKLTDLYEKPAASSKPPATLSHDAGSKAISS
jgi:cation transport ATPase